MKRAALISGFILLAAGTIATIVFQGLALTDSERAPAWSTVFAALYVAFAGALLVLMSSVARKSPIVWTTATSIPPSLQETPRNLVSSHASRRLVLTVGIVFAALAVNMTGGFYPYFRQWAALRNRGAEMTGLVTRRETVRKGATVYYLHYRYGNVENADDVPPETFKRLLEGDRVPVTYLRSQPQVALAMRRADLTVGHLLTKYWELVLMVIAPLLIIPPLARLITIVERRLTRTVQHGRATLARVTDVRRASIEYAFAGGNGLILPGRRRVAGEPRVGDEIVIFYDETDPRHNVALLALDEIAIVLSP